MKRKLIAILAMTTIMLASLSVDVLAWGKAPVLSDIPENGVYIKLSWTKVSGAKGYQIYCNGKKVSAQQRV